jgi:hypothetical protein
MNLSARHNVYKPAKAFVALSVLLTGFLGSVIRAETPGELHLMNGRVVPGWITGLEGESLGWKARTGQVRTLPLASVREVRLILPADFLEAVKTLRAGTDPDAISVLATYADQTNPKNYFPLPGNLSSRAALALFEHFRSTGRVKEAAEWAAQVDPSLLPNTSPPQLLELYRAYEREHSGVLSMLQNRLTEVEDTSRFEVAYLIGVIHERRGEPADALEAYARVYSPDASVRNPFAGLAMARSVDLLRSDPPDHLPNPQEMITALETFSRALSPSDSTP